MTPGHGFVEELTRRKRLGLVPVIAEIKPSVPVHGDLLRGREPERLVEEYTLGGAACLSVVTGRWFGGGPALLERVARISRLPLLRKDFIRTAADLVASRDMGAQAVLLTARFHDARCLRELVAGAAAIGLTAFVEVASTGELARAIAADPPVIAVSNRDIMARETRGPGLAASAALIACRSATSTVYVSASGLQTADDALHLMRLGFDAVLIGTALLRAGSALEALRGFTCLALPS
jgi:indole-3-glycerol phosphate synthase